ncbi:MAG: SO_0444 family Cu/Zn efflux transporter [Thiotrichaceae bacterium]|nr:SO_0444 family Cu/Zn efflux transporter [Thiotrichaceae bacterium]
MQELTGLLIHNFWLLLNSIAPYILIGVLVAGVFKQLIPTSFIKKHLGKKGFITNIKAALLGIPLPLCSCSVIPFVSALRKAGASKSAVQTFLIATPITGVDSILATYGVFGWLFTLYRVLSSLVIALLAGFLSLLWVKEDDTDTKLEDIPQSCCHSQHQAASCQTEKVSKSHMIRQIFHHAFDQIYKDIAKPLMLGIVLGALIMTMMPDNLAQYLSSNPWLNYIIILAVSMPLYVCATASIPLGLSLLSAGFSPGAAFIFLTAGPATNAITMSVVFKVLGKASLLIYLFSVLAGSVIFAYTFDYFFAESRFITQILNHHEESPSVIAQISAVILLGLSVWYIIIRRK